MITKYQFYESMLNSEEVSSEFKKLSFDDFMKLCFYWSHARSELISGRRLTPTGLFVCSAMYPVYEYESDLDALTGKHLLILSNMLKMPWAYHDNKIFLFEKKILSELKLIGSLERYLNSMKTKKYF